MILYDDIDIGVQLFEVMDIFIVMLRILVRLVVNELMLMLLVVGFRMWVFMNLDVVVSKEFLIQNFLMCILCLQFDWYEDVIVRNVLWQYMIMYDIDFYEIIIGYVVNLQFI